MGGQGTLSSLHMRAPCRRPPCCRRRSSKAWPPRWTTGGGRCRARWPQQPYSCAWLSSRRWRQWAGALGGRGLVNLVGQLQSIAATCPVYDRVTTSCRRNKITLCRALADGVSGTDVLLSLLSMLLSTHDGVAALQHRFLRGTLGLLSRLAVQVATAWRAAGGASADDLLAAHPSAPQEVVVALNTALPVSTAGEAASSGDMAAAVEPEAGASLAAAGAPASKAAAEAEASLAALRAQQAELLEQLSDAADVLRFWSRRSEKAAAGGEGGPAAGREGDTPPMLAEVRCRVLGGGQRPHLLALCIVGSTTVGGAGRTGIAAALERCAPVPTQLAEHPSYLQAQQLLWAACHTYEDEQAAADVRTRQLVCQRYRPLDVAALQVGAHCDMGG